MEAKTDYSKVAQLIKAPKVEFLTFSYPTNGFSPFAGELF
jgi:hypothetical protein